MPCWVPLFFAAPLLLAASVAVAGSFDSLLLQKDASGYAERMAAMIDDRAECRVFKEAILAQSKNSMYAGSTAHAIVTAKQRPTPLAAHRQTRLERE